MTGSGVDSEAGYVVHLTDPHAVAERVGGKAASLARLAGAGLPVADGFSVSTDAYREFAEDFRTSEAPPGLVAAVTAAYAALGDDDPPVAVRSSATAEDLSDLSFAGQYESYLNVRGAEAVVAAVGRCWASLATERAAGYLRRHGIDPDSVAMAVVVQKLVPAEVSGVCFTADPVTGARDSVVVNAVWGLGEALVGGEVSADTYRVGSEPDPAVEAVVADKAAMTVPTATGTATAPVDEDRRRRATLDEGTVVRLAALARRVERLYATPVDIEWALHDGELFLLQARPITTPVTEAPEVEPLGNDESAAEFLWTRANIGEAVPSVMTPATWWLVRAYMQRLAWMSLDGIPGVPVLGTLAGRCYINLSAVLSVSRDPRYQLVMRETFKPVPEPAEISGLPIAGGRLAWTLIKGAYRSSRALRPFLRDFEGRAASVREKSTGALRNLAAAGSTEALAGLWRTDVDPLLAEAMLLFAAGGRLGRLHPAQFAEWLRARGVSEEDVAALHGVDNPELLASLGPVLGLERVRDGGLDRDTYVELWGHRSPDEFEISVPRPAEQPRWLDARLAGLHDAPADVSAAIKSRRHRRAEAVERFTRGHPKDARSFKRQLARVEQGIGGRETGRSELSRALAVARRFWLRAGELTGHGDDLFFLELPEVLAVLGGDETATGRVAGRRAAYEQFRARPEPPALVRGLTDPASAAASAGPVARAAAEQPAPADGDALHGYPGSAGLVTGTARLLRSFDEADTLRPGEILVTSATNVGWTPLFPRVAAVVTDLGAPLSHAAIVARELGIPAVVGCAGATARIRTADRITVDGTRGTVTVHYTKDI